MSVTEDTLELQETGMNMLNTYNILMVPCDEYVH